MKSELTDEPGKRKRFLVYTVILVIAGGSLFDIVTGKEHWPFSPYPMFSKIRRDHSLTRLQLLGVTKSAPHREIPLSKFKHVQLLDHSRLSGALKKPMNTTRRQYLRQALYNVLLRYEESRQAGDHGGPPLQGIRLYSFYWSLDPQVRNIDRPDRRELILEIKDSVRK